MSTSSSQGVTFCALFFIPNTFSGLFRPFLHLEDSPIETPKNISPLPAHTARRASVSHTAISASSSSPPLPFRIGVNKKETEREYGAPRRHRCGSCNLW